MIKIIETDMHIFKMPRSVDLDLEKAVWGTDELMVYEVFEILINKGSVVLYPALIRQGQFVFN